MRHAGVIRALAVPRVALALAATAAWAAPSPAVAAQATTATPSAAAAQAAFDVAVERGVAALRRGDHVTAEAALREALAMAPGHPFASAMLGNTLVEQGRADEALPLLQQATHDAPDLRVAWIGLARAQLALGDDEEAIVPLRNALRLEPDPALQLQLAQTLRRAGRTAEALDVATAAAAARPADLLPERLRISLLLDLERDLEALDALAAFLQRQPGDVDALTLYGDILVRSTLGFDARIAAAAAYRQALAHQPEDLALLRRLIPLYSELGLNAEAVALLDGAADAVRTDIELALWRGRLLSRQQKYAAAREALEEAIAAGAGAPGWYQMGIVEVNLSDLDAAVAAFRQALELDPEMAVAYRELGKVLEDRGEHEQAAQLLQRAVAMLPQDPTANALVGAAELRAGRPEVALPLLDRAVQLAPRDPQPLYDRAIALRQLGRADESRAAMEAFREVEAAADATGDSEETRRARARGVLQQGMVRLRLVGPGAALPFFDQAVELDGGLAIAWYGKGLSHAGLEQWPEAAAAFERNVSLDPERPDGYMGLADAYARLGREADAERMRARADELMARLQQR